MIQESKDLEEIEQYRNKLKQVAWRIQYRARMERLRELLVINGMMENLPDREFNILSNLYVEEFLKNISSEQGRFIIRRLIIEGHTEKEVATELKISQQAVNQWKKKGIEMLRKSIARS